MQLSAKALAELREALRKTHGEDFERNLSDDDVNHLGLLFLEIVVQSLKLRVKKHS